MDCPADGTTLLMSERQGVEIDYCPQCRGVWLDRGELDKIVERADREQPEPSRESYREPDRPPYSEQKHGDQKSGDQRYGHKPRKRKGFLGEIFDFD